MTEEDGLWLVIYSIPGEIDHLVEAFNDGIIPVIARNKYEAIGKAMTVPGIETTIIDPASIKAERLSLLHSEDKKYAIRIEELSDVANK